MSEFYVKPIIKINTIVDISIKMQQSCQNLR